ncbi:MAG: hypothetical protein ABI156_10020 [Caldimonas sp.]
MKLDIDTLDLVVEAVATPERADRLTRSCEAAVAQRLPASLATLLGRVASDLTDDTAEIFIDRLDLECQLSANWDADAIARELAGQIERQLARCEHRIVFRDRAEFIAALLTAIVNGSVGQRWWFDGWRGLAPLSMSNALRTVLLDEDEVGVAALSRMTADASGRIVASLVDGDAGRVLASIGAREGIGLSTMAVWRLAERFDAGTTGPGLRVTALLDAERLDAGTANAATLHLLETFVALRTRSGAPNADFDRSTDARQGLARRCATAGLDDRWLQALDDDACKHIARGIGPVDVRDERGAAHDDAASAEIRFTAHFGGVFLLRVVLSRLGWTQAWAAARVPGLDASAIEALAWLIACRAAVGSTMPSMQDAHTHTEPWLWLDTCAGTDWLAAIAKLPAAAASTLRRSGSAATPPSRASRRPRNRVDASAGDTRRGRADAGVSVVAMRRPIATALDHLATDLLEAFAERLAGADGASADWLRANVLEFPARFQRTATALDVRIGRPPLEVLLALSGWATCECPLADGRRLILKRADW